MLLKSPGWPGGNCLFLSVAWSPGCLWSPRVLPEASRLNCGTPSGEGPISPSVPSWGVLAKQDSRLVKKHSCLICISVKFVASDVSA